MCVCFAMNYGIGNGIERPRFVLARVRDLRARKTTTRFVVTAHDGAPTDIYRQNQA